jgi:hypothetical protein
VVEKVIVLKYDLPYITSESVLTYFGCKSKIHYFLTKEPEVSSNAKIITLNLFGQLFHCTFTLTLSLFKIDSVQTVFHCNSKRWICYIICNKNFCQLCEQ